MNGRFLLDTNIIISFFAEDPLIHKHIINAPEIFVPCIAIGELFFGAYKSSKTKENLSLIDEFAIRNTVLACNADTAKIYGEIKSKLREKGQPIPENDIWIAAIAMQHSLELVTRDTHFTAVENLEVKLW